MTIGSMPLTRRPGGYRPVPSDWATTAPRLTQTALSAHYRCGIAPIHRWAEETGIHPMPTPTLYPPVPADFAQRAAEMLKVELSRHYHAHHRTLLRWFDEAGIAPLKRVPSRPDPSTPSGYRRLSGVAKRAYAALATTLRRDVTMEGQAADHLRRYAAVYRCTPGGGVVDDKARLTHWRYGNAVLTSEEMIARAMRNGFRPDAWREIAA
jgi:hypothetical protein